MVSFREDSTELRMRENRIFFLPVNILKVLRVGFLGCMTHYRVSRSFQYCSAPVFIRQIIYTHNTTTKYFKQ